MTKTIETPLSPFIKSFGDAWAGLLDDSTEVTRASAQAYLTGLKAATQQGRVVGATSRKWVSDLVSAQSDFSHELVRSYRPAHDQVAAAAANSVEVAEETVGREAPRARTASAKPKGRRTAAARRTRRSPTTPASSSALAAAVGSGLAKWTSDGYDSLTAAEIIEKLPQFSQRDLRDAESYEKAHQARQTVLQRMSSLRGQEPVAGYDELTVPEIQEQLGAGDEGLATSVREYERQHKDRSGVLQAATQSGDEA